MFRGGTKEKDAKEIVISEMTYHALRTCIEYCYTDDAVIDGDHAVDILAAANCLW